MLKEYRYTTNMMGTKLVVLFWSEFVPNDTYERIASFGQSIEHQFSRFLSFSELSLLNHNKNRIVTKLFWEIFLLGTELYQITDGVFNPFLSPDRLGYDKDFNQYRKHFYPISNYINNLRNISFLEIITDPNTKKIELRDNQVMDFGGFLKGWTVQKMREFVQPEIPMGIINLGGDMITFGKIYNQPEAKIYNPVIPEKTLSLFLDNKVLATSGTYKRKWGNFHHILDPENQSSTQSDLISASVIHADGFIADAFATTAIVLGSERAIVFLKKQTCEYILIKNNGDIVYSETLNIKK